MIERQEIRSRERTRQSLGHVIMIILLAIEQVGE